MRQLGDYESLERPVWHRAAPPLINRGQQTAAVICLHLHVAPGVGWGRVASGQCAVAHEAGQWKPWADRSCPETRAGPDEWGWNAMTIDGVLASVNALIDDFM